MTFKSSINTNKHLGPFEASEMSCGTNILTLRQSYTEDYPVFVHCLVFQK